MLHMSPCAVAQKLELPPSMLGMLGSILACHAVQRAALVLPYLAHGLTDALRRNSHRRFVLLGQSCLLWFVLDCALHM